MGLTDFGVYDIEGVNDNIQPSQEVTVRAQQANGQEERFQAIGRIHSPVEVKYYRNGGILQAALRDMLKA